LDHWNCRGISKSFDILATSLIVLRNYFVLRNYLAHSNHIFISVFSYIFRYFSKIVLFMINVNDNNRNLSRYRIRPNLSSDACIIKVNEKTWFYYYLELCKSYAVGTERLSWKFTREACLTFDRCWRMT